jgi:NHLM bacteriocin system ABC transporter peptidase/ATP-binding protein
MTASFSLLRGGRRVRSPTILQMDAAECGAASLAMVLAYHGRWAPLEELRLRCGVSRDGTKASNIVKVAREFGLAAKGFRKEPGELASLPLPSIIHWNFNHFLVFEGVRGESAYLNDPALGRRRVALAELEECFTGVVLAFERTPEFARGGAPAPVWGALLSRLARSRAGLALVLFATVALVAPGIVAASFAKIFIDQILVQGYDNFIKPLLIGMAATAALRGALTWLQSRALTRLETKLAAVSAAEMVWRLLRLPVAFFTQRHAGDLAQRVAALEDVAQLLSNGVAQAALGLAGALFFALAMAAFNAKLAAIAVPLTLLNALALALVGRRREAAAQRLFKERSLVSAATVGMLASIETLKAGGFERDAFSRWAGFHAKELAASRAFDETGLSLAAFPPFVAAVSFAVQLGVGADQVVERAISVGDLVAFLALSVSFADPIGRLVAFGGQTQQIKANLSRAGDIAAYPLDARTAAPSVAEVADLGRPRSATAATARLSGRIELRGVTYGYSLLDPPTIKPFDLIVRPGARVALVGASGSGKSTIGKLIAGLYAPWEGEIRFDDRPASDIPRDVIANSLGYVDQNVFLFEGSVRDNLTLWDRGEAEASLIEALRDAAILADVVVRPGGLDAAVAEGGANFSGGQRQRLEIARALVVDPSLIVLDEAMAALDPIVEKQIDDSLRQRGCACIIIAHRLSTIRDCDEIIMLARGEVIGRGTHTQLLATCREYAELLHAQ